MRKFSLVSIAVIIILSIFFLLLQAGDEKAKGETIEGTLVDLKCYSTGGFVINDQ